MTNKSTAAEEPIADAVETPIVTEEPQVTSPFDFEYGDLVVQCKCGRTQVITKGIEQGLSLVITNKHGSFIQLKCDECDSEMTLRLVEGVKPEVPVEITEPIATIEVVEKETDEVIQEESKQESSL
jgi:hypothetical protein